MLFYNELSIIVRAGALAILFTILDKFPMIIDIIFCIWLFIEKYVSTKIYYGEELNTPILRFMVLGDSGVGTTSNQKKLFFIIILLIVTNYISFYFTE